ncbi:proline-rich receptor-like protein kinase PERK9 [Iris pallida]|uniref:Proline-rich receptor-like protein kinase PERK9 n=1 Tax=Iris pallida TaxID=29817 RepID=A0AAX6GN19_IRIPA|nr:proline-rich receptor-like protein kinase PERK9 [Iris pallida]
MLAPQRGLGGGLTRRGASLVRGLRDRWRRCRGTEEPWTRWHCALGSGRPRSMTRFGGRSAVDVQGSGDGFGGDNRGGSEVGIRLEFLFLSGVIVWL